MLEAPLLVTRTFKGHIKPVYALPSPEVLALAESMISTYCNGIGKRESEIASEVKDLEYGPFDHRLVRGLRALLERRSAFEMESPVDPQALRRALFAESKGFASGKERDCIIERVAARLKIRPEDAERLFWADLESERVMKSFQPIKPRDLIAEYNLSLTQTLLFRSTVLEFTVTQNWKRIFRNIKRLGLMYSIQKADGGYLVSVEGPTSIIKLTERYGICLAKLLPGIILGDAWSIRAQIVSRFRENKRLLTFELSSSDRILLPPMPADAEPFDSKLEEGFAARFNAMGTGWKLRREPEPIPTGTSVMIPDFSFELGDQRVFLEVVGFWTPDYIERKIAKLRQVEGCDLLVAADRELGISKKAHMSIIEFEKEVPLKPILDHLEAKAKLALAYEADRLSRIDIAVDGDIVPLKGLALRLGVSKEALKKRLSGRPAEGYLLIGDTLIRNEKMAELEKLVSGERKLSALSKKLESEGFVDPFPLMEHFGYTVKIAGIDMAGAQVVKKGK